MSPTVRPSRHITFAVLAVSVASFVLLQALVVPVLAETQRQYDTSQTTVTWVLTGYLLSASIATPLLGRVGDAVGKRRVLVATLAALAVGSLLAAVAPTIGWLVAARVVQGLGGGVLPLSFGIIRDEFGESMTGAISMLSSLTAVGFGAGIVLAGPIVDSLGYAWLYWLPMIATSAAAVAALLFVPESPVRTPGRLPMVPAVLLSGWLVTLLLALSYGNEWGWASARILGLLAATVVLAALWVTVELRVPVPMIDMHMMRRRGVWTTNVVAAFVGFGMFASFGFLPLLLQTPREAGYGFSATITESGHLMLPSAVASFVMGFVTARAVRLIGARRLILLGAAMVGCSFAAIGLFHDEKWQLYVATVLQGIGSGAVFAALAGVVVSAVPPAQTGVASGMNANIRTIGGSIGTAVMTGIVTAHVDSRGIPLERGYTVGFLLLGAAMLVAAGAAAFIPDTHRQATSGPLEDADNAELAYVPGGVRPA